MRTAFLIMASSFALISQAAYAQETTETTTSFRGVRIEGNVGGDRFQSQGVHDDNFGYGGTIGFDGVIGGKIVVGPEGSYWRANNWAENCTPGVAGGSICHKSFEEWGAAVRVGYLVSPKLLVFGKGGYVHNDQRQRFDAPAGQTSFYDHFGIDGYQAGGGVEYSLPNLPVYVNAQYVYSQYSDHTSRQRLMAGIGFRFK